MQVRVRFHAARETFALRVSIWNRSKNFLNNHNQLILSFTSLIRIYECGSECKCRSSCLNRVVQHGVRVRLQVFRTGRSGWSVRCLQDLVKGTFVCVFAGHVHELKQWEQLDREATYALDLNLKDFQQVDQEVQQLFEQHMAKLNR